ncbi:hypothetical protein J437_LFUL011477 [Ladona fulva]|uniref:Copper transport protein n=1 Tax=Ladona fulva TaxID=123851 RepID=A0A8K0P2W4_LADFU|nr:hypothetical protein J437_LFUL011477 [Ladona fulva]
MSSSWAQVLRALIYLLPQALIHYEWNVITILFYSKFYLKTFISYREYLFWRTYNSIQYRSVTTPDDKTSVGTSDHRIVHFSFLLLFRPTMLSWAHALQTCLHIIQVIISYFLMLIFMTYNVWLCLAVLVGAATGYFLFGWKKSVVVDVTEHCH